MNLGIDIGGTNVSYGIVDHIGHIIYAHKIPIASFKDPKEAFQYLNQDITNHGLKIDTVGIGAPMLTKTGQLIGAANIPWTQPCNIKNIASAVFGTSVYTDNDANCTLIGEYKFGKLKNVLNGVIVTLGTGIGGGLLLNGKPFAGAHGYAGEVGHIVYQPNGRPCKCGKLGCFEKYIAASGMITTYQELKSDYANSLLTEWEIQQKVITPQTICEAALLHDKLALAIFDKMACVLAELLDVIVCAYNPEKIILFGGIVNAGDLLVKPTLAYFSQKALSVYQNNLIIEVSDIQEGDMAILGASAICEL